MTVAVWQRIDRSHHRLIDAAGTDLGRYRSQLPDVAAAAATINTTRISLTGTGTLRRELTATDADHRILGTLRASTLSWHGQIELAGAERLQLRRAPALNLRWLVGPESLPTSVIEVRRQRVHFSCPTEVLCGHPALAALTMYLMQHHRAGSMTR